MAGDPTAQKKKHGWKVFDNRNGMRKQSAEPIIEDPGSTNDSTAIAAAMDM